MVQALRRRASHAGGSDSIAGWGTKMSYAAHLGQKYKIKRLNLKKKKNYKGTVLYPPQSHTPQKTADCPAGFRVALVDVPTVSPVVFLGCVSPVAQMVKGLPANSRDSVLISGPGRSPGGGRGNPLQRSRPENPSHGQRSLAGLWSTGPPKIRPGWFWSG